MRGAEMNYRVGCGCQETCRRVSRTLVRDPASQTQGPLRTVWPGILRIAGQNGADLTHQVFAVVMELGDPQKLRLHQDQAPDG